MSLDQIQTVALAGLVLFLGYGIRRAVPVLARYNIPAAVIGGLCVAVALTAARTLDWSPVRFETALQAPLMIAFFTSIGFGASLSLLRSGGPAVALFFGFSSVMAIAQNVIGAAAAWMLGREPLLGVLAGSVTLTGGPATGLAFAPLFEAAGVTGAATVAIAAAMAGIVAGALIGGPVGTRLIGSLRRSATVGAAPVVEAQSLEPTAASSGENRRSHDLLKALVLILVSMWAGTWLTRGFDAIGVTLPVYIGAMIIAAALRNLDEAFGLIDIPQQTIDDVGTTALSLFLVMALMTLRLWDLVGLALPLTAILFLQIAAVAVSAGLLFKVMGRDYEAAVMSSGYCGFMLGTTANAMANMNALVERYGPAPQAFLIVPMVGAFFIDFVNALLITACLNIWA